jgi:primosomal protein N' (replication factor Y)
MLRKDLPGVMVFGPGDPMVPKIRNQYLKRILIKINRGSGKLSEIKTRIQEAINTFSKEKEFRKIRVVVNVDP